MGKYGWDKFREEGLKELTNIKESGGLASREAQVSFLDKYLEIYREQKEHEIKGTAFYPEKIGKEEAQKQASDVIKRLRESIKKYYESEDGKISLYEIYFIADQRDYRLGIRLKKKNRLQFVHEDEIILYNEHRYFAFVQKPFLIKILSLLFSFLSPLLIVLLRIPTQVATRFRFKSPPDSDSLRHPLEGEERTLDKLHKSR